MFAALSVLAALGALDTLGVMVLGTMMALGVTALGVTALGAATAK